MKIDQTMDPTSDQYKEMVAGFLDRLDPAQPKGTVLCDAIMRIWTTAAFEAMAFRLNTNGIEIYLRRRAMDEIAYPGEWHAPGSLYRHGEQDRDVANRLEKEFGVPIKKSFKFVGKDITSEARGTVHSMIFLVQLDGNPRIDDRHNWFPVNSLPEVTVDIHRDLLIPTALLVYRHRHQ